ncbi:TonB-dependent receptor domain-containing protein [Shewanella maritima]|uniref:TonB-dependent receptor domain-containing protein n=1 Tax=Shewanella maritima TaxID=2520507 RepID=UPI0037351778
MSFKIPFFLITLVLCQPYAKAAPEQPSTVDEVITVTGSRFDNSVDSKLTVINTIEREEIEAISPKSVIDVLEKFPGLSVTRYGGASQNASVSMRGTNSNHVLVLVDGQRISSATLGSVNFGSISPENVKRIEIVKGPRASIWGSDAIGGVIQIFTRKLESGEWFTSTELGSNNYLRGTVGAGISHGEGSSAVTINGEKSDGFDIHDGAPEEADDDGYKRIGVAINGEQSINEQWLVDWNLRYDQGNNEYDDVYSSGSSNKTDYRNYMWNIGTQYNGNSYSTEVNIGQSQEHNSNFRDDNPNIPVLIYETSRDQISWTNQLKASDNLRLIGGIDWYKEKVIGDYSVNERHVWGGYALAQYTWNNFLFEGSLRHDDVENIDSATSHNLSVAYHINNQWSISVGTGTGFKAPTFNDLYWPDSGNPDLVSETSNSYEVTFNYQGKSLQGYVSFFQNNIHDLIAWAPETEGSPVWKPTNINDAKINGVELSLSTQLWGGSHQLSYTYLDAVDSNSNEDLIGRSENELDYSIGYQWDKFDLLFNYHYQGKRYSGSDTYLDSYNQVDISIGYLFENNWQLRLKANNIFDEKIVSLNNYNINGMEFFLSLSYHAF